MYGYFISMVNLSQYTLCKGRPNSQRSTDSYCRRMYVCLTGDNFFRQSLH